jgi:hypothetical protein
MASEVPILGGTGLGQDEKEQEERRNRCTQKCLIKCLKGALIFRQSSPP